MRSFVFPFFRDLEQGSVKEPIYARGCTQFSLTLSRACDVTFTFGDDLAHEGQYARERATDERLIDSHTCCASAMLLLP